MKKVLSTFASNLLQFPEGHFKKMLRSKSFKMCLVAD